MDVKIEDVTSLTKKVTITLASDAVQPKLDEAYDKLKKEVKMKGFRRGKVPRSVIIKNYQGQVQAEVGEKLVQDNYFEAIEQENIDPITHPDIKDATFNDDGSFTFIAEVSIKPEFELGEYKGLEIEKVEILVTDEEVELELNEMQRSMAALTSVGDRAIAKDDIATIDFQGFHEGEAMPQVKNDNYSVDVGSGNMGVEFEEKLLGMKRGEQATYELEFPESHLNPILKGKKVEFQVEIKDVKERILADLDDEFAKDAGEDFNTLDELKADIRKKLTTQREEKAEATLTDRIMQKLLDAHEFEVPDRLVAFEIEQMVKQTEQQFEQSGMSLEAAGLSREQLAEQNAPVATQRVRGDFILKKIAEQEEIKVEDADLERGFKRIGDMYNMSVAKVKEFFQSRDDLLPFMNELHNEKILAFLRAESVLVDAPAEEEEVKESEETPSES